MKINDLQLNAKCKNPFNSSKMRERKERGKNSLFDLMDLYLNNNQMKEWCEILLVIIQLLQVLSYAISEKFQDVWKGQMLFSNICIVLSYFKLSPLFRGNYYVYYIAYYTAILLVLVVFISVIIQIIHLSKESMHCLAFYKATGWILKMLSSVLFIPIAELLFSMFICENGVNLYQIKSECYKGVYIIHCVIGGIALLYFLCQAFVVLNLVYEIRPKPNIYSSKKTVQSDSTFLFVKCLLVLTCPPHHDVKVTQIVIALNAIALFYMAYVYTVMSPYYSFPIQKTYLSLAYCSAWSFVILFVGTVLKDFAFDGVFELCFIGNILIVFGLVLSSKRLNVGLILQSMIKSGDEVIDQLDEVVSIIEKQKDFRTAQIALIGYVKLINEKTIDINSPLKKYADIEQDKSNTFYLVFHINNLYLSAIAKYPTNIRLRVSYALFLFEKASRRDQALTQLENAKRYRLALCEEFTLYRLIKSIDQHSETLVRQVNIDLTESINNLAYDKLFVEFKELVSSAAHLYVDFWNLLLNPQHDNQTELAQLNNLGTNINSIVENVYENYNKMQKIKPTDYDMLLFYYHFTHDILNDKDKAQQLKSKLNDCENDSSAKLDESNLCHLDFTSLSSFDDDQFLIVSAMDESLGEIAHISVSAATLLGYLREELIGQSIELIIPEMFNSSHRKYLTSIVTQYKRKFFEDYSTYQNFRPSFVEFHFYARTKSRFIIPLYYKSAFFPNDNHQQYFYIKVLNDKSISSISKNQYLLYILTNSNLVIQNFSANAMNVLGLSSNAMNSSKVISDYIKELSEDFLQFIIDDNEAKESNGYSLKNKVQLKLQIIKAKYSNPVAVTWSNSSMNAFEISRLRNQPVEESMQNSRRRVRSFYSTQRMKVAPNSKNIMLKVDEIAFLKEAQGLMFILEPIWHFNFREKVGLNPPLQSLKEVITPFTRKSQKLKLNELLLDDIHSSPRKVAVLPPDFIADNKIDKAFLPDVTGNKFKITSKLSYVQVNSHYHNEEDSTDFIKQLALNKQRLMLMKHHTTTSSGITEESYADDSDTDSNGTSSDNESNEHELGFRVNSRTNLNATKDDLYYKVDMKNIKYSIFDYTKKAFIEQSQYVKLCEIETKLFEETNKLSKMNFNTANGETSPKSPKLKHSSIMRVMLDTADPIEKAKLIQKEILKKEIASALKQNNLQSIVFLFYILSILACALVLTRTLCYLMQSLQCIKDIDEVTFLIYSAVKLQKNMLMAVFSIRELTLLSIPLYTGYNYDKEKYASDLKGYLNSNIFMVNTEHIKNITTSSHRLSDEQMATLDTVGGVYYSLDAKFNRNINKISLQTSIELTNSALFHIINKEEEKIKATSRDFFSYSFNGLNGLFIGLEKQIELYYANYDALQELLRVKVIVVFVLIEIALIVSFFIMRLGLIKISQKNDSYLSLFYTISRSLIAHSFDKCETFLFRFNLEFKTDKIEEATNEDPQVNDNRVITEDATLLPSKEGKNEKKTKGSSSTIYKHKFVGHFAQAHIGVLIAIVLIVGFDTFLLVKLLLFENETYRAITIYKSVNLIQQQIILAFTLLRELAFDGNALFSFEPLSETIVAYLDYTLDTYQKEKRKADAQLLYLPQFYSDLFYRINQKSVCNYLANSNDDLCGYFTDTAGFHGLDQVILYTFDTTRFLYYRSINVKMAQTHYNFTYNLTVYGTDAYKNYLPPDPKLHPFYNRVGPMFIFNSVENKKLLMIFSTILSSAFNDLISSISYGIDNNIISMKFFFILSLASSMGLTALLFVGVWFPFIKKMNTTIYKTKNMLSIIPIDILASLNNITHLLEISIDHNQTDNGLTARQ